MLPMLLCLSANSANLNYIDVQISHIKNSTSETMLFDEHSHYSQCLMDLSYLQAGMYYFQLMDWYIGIFTLLFISAIECIIVSWIYGKYK